MSPASCLICRRRDSVSAYAGENCSGARVHRPLRAVEQEEYEEDPFGNACEQSWVRMHELHRAQRLLKRVRDYSLRTVSVCLM